jgi:hypothetical protein
LGTFGDASPRNVLRIEKTWFAYSQKFEEEQKVVLDLKFGRGLKIFPRARHYEYGKCAFLNAFQAPPKQQPVSLSSLSVSLPSSLSSV